MDWLTQLSTPMKAALIGAITAVVVGIGRDFISRWWFSRRDERRRAKDVFRIYAEPLAAASMSLFWRLREILAGDGRATFLLSQKNTTAFEDYKLRSTYYRLAVMMAWIRALRRELTFFKMGSGGRLQTVEDALRNFEKALADGHHVEFQRLEELAKLWNAPQINNDRAWSRLAVNVEVCYKRVLRAEKKLLARDLNPESKKTLCRDIADQIARECRIENIPKDLLSETTARAVSVMDIREAWLYRDWQAAIGDLLIKPQQNSPRRFDVVGFGEFEQMMLSPTDEIYRWLDRLSQFLVDVDVDNRSNLDARPTTIRNTYIAVAGLIVALNKVDRGHHLIDENSFKLAQNELKATGV